MQRNVETLKKTGNPGELNECYRSGDLLVMGASTANILIFLSAWACIKIPQTMMELRFLGLKFMVVRLILTTVFVVLMAFFIDALVRRSEEKSAGTEPGNDLGTGRNRMEEK